MKKITALFVLPFIMLSSCNYNRDDKIAREEYISVVNNILQKNDKELKNLFAYNVSSKISLVNYILLIQNITLVYFIVVSMIMMIKILVFGIYWFKNVVMKMKHLSLIVAMTNG